MTLLLLLTACGSSPRAGPAQRPATTTPLRDLEPAPAQERPPESPPASALSLIGAGVVDNRPVAVDRDTVDRWVAEFSAAIAEGGGSLPPDYDADAFLGRYGLDSAEALALAKRVDVRAMTYDSDGLKIQGFVAAPRSADAPLPCLVVNRGGHNRAPIDEVTAFGWLAMMADWGYVVIASNYRGSPGSEGVDEFGGADIADVLNLATSVNASILISDHWNWFRR
ncbi:MAG: hypothetical protein AAF721_13040 [Myxococcota bacterium]